MLHIIADLVSATKHLMADTSAQRKRGSNLTELQSFAEKVNAYCRALNGSVVSWIRSDKHNADVGGVAMSLHRFGLAVDVVYDVPVEKDQADTFAAGLGLTLIRELNHDHLQPLKRE